MSQLSQYSMLTSLWNRRAKKELASAVSKFVDEVETQMGAKLFILAGYRDTDGQVCKVKSVFFLIFLVNLG